MFQPNIYQEAVFSAVASQSNNLVVVARAGTGKTTTILEAVNKIGSRGGSVLVCAFNKVIQKELESRAPGYADVRTLHSLGYGCLRRVQSFEVDGDKTKKLAKRLINIDGFVPGRQAALTRLVGLAKNTMTTGVKKLKALAFSHGLDESETPAELLAEMAESLLDLCLEDTSVIDFDDMIWLPAVLDLKPRCYDTVFVDEAQDLNACQLWMIEGTLRRGGRIIAVGDDRQAIYGWRGAGGDMLKSLQKQFQAELLPLSLTYRCPKSVVRLVKKIVPDFEALPDAPEGEIIRKGISALADEAKPGDLVLSRFNAPLMPVFLSLLEKDIPARVRGKDIGRSLASLAKKSKVTSISDLNVWLQAYRAQEKERLLPDHEDAFDLLNDEISCLTVLSKGQANVSALCRRIEGIFSDDSDSDGHVLCSTVHKAKGMERPRVWILMDTFKLGKSTEEDNIYYVAITRVQETLFTVGNADTSVSTSIGRAVPIPDKTYLKSDWELENDEGHEEDVLGKVFLDPTATIRDYDDDDEYDSGWDPF